MTGHRINIEYSHRANFYILTCQCGWEKADKRHPAAIRSAKAHQTKHNAPHETTNSQGLMQHHPPTWDTQEK